MKITKIKIVLLHETSFTESLFLNIARFNSRERDVNIDGVYPLGLNYKLSASYEKRT